MNKPVETCEEREERLGELFSDWLEELESGGHPDRQQWLARHPEFAKELEELLAQEDRLRALTAPLRETARAANESTPPPWDTIDAHDRSVPANQPRPESFGDYELVEEIGRGGMAIVYRARQKGLDRFVALKLFRTDPLARPTDLQRFRHEAEIVAHLDHPAIVPIHEVGQHHNNNFFTMKLIEGGSLDAHLAHFVSNTCSAVALMVSISRAVHHAHQRGILHRDLKPSNILVTRTTDRTGESFVPHIGDFGLARRIDSAAGLTQTGAILGTPAYMAPEQAAGGKAAITTATDVYGLGAILYALLTGKPPFWGDSVFETIARVKERDPVPPRQLRAKLSRDIETICLKCLRKEPQGRYESAAALADDLERWLKGEPIAARPVGRVERLWRWCRRQPLQAALSLALLLAVIGGFTLVVWQWRRAEANLQSAQRLGNELSARTVELDESFRLAHEVVQDFSGVLQKGGRVEQQRLDPLRLELYERARKYYKIFLERHGRDPAMKFELVKASASLAMTIREIGSQSEALVAYEYARDQVDALSKEEPENLPLRHGLAEIHNHLASVYDSVGRRNDALDSLRKAKEILDAALQEHPDDAALLAKLANTYHNMGMYHAASHQVAEAQRNFGEARSLLEKLLVAQPNEAEFKYSLANTLNSLGMLHSEQGQLAKAVQSFRMAADLSDRLARLYPAHRALQHGLAQQLCNLGDSLCLLDDAKQALPSLLRARGILQDLTRDHPHIVEYRSSLGLCSALLGRASLGANELTQAAQAHDAARDIFRQLSLEHPEIPNYAYRLNQVLMDMALTHKRFRQLKPAADRYEDARQVGSQLVEKYPHELKYAAQLAVILHHLAIVQGDSGRLHEARKSVLQAVEWERRVLAKSDPSVTARRELTGHYALLAAIDRDLGEIEEAMDCATKRRALWPNAPAELFDVAVDYAATGSAKKADDASRLRCADLAMEALGQAMEAGFRDAERVRATAPFELLRSRQDFQKLLRQMNKSP